MNEDGKSGTLVTIMRNVQSGESDQTKQQKDFEQAIQSWKGDDYLLQRLREGMYVKDRNLTIENNVLVWTEKAIFSDLGDIFKHEFKNDTLRFVIKGDQKIISTNGIIQSAKDSTVVFWALAVSKEIFLTTKENNFTPASDFAAMFRTYMKNPK
jgi:dihydroxyacetone kinase-like predicted kinase